MTEPKTDHAAEAEAYLHDLGSLGATDAYVAVMAAQAHSNLAQLAPAREMVELQRQLLASMLPPSLNESKVEWQRLDVANAQTDAHAKGVEDLRTAALQAIREERASAVDFIRRDAHDNDIKLIEGLQP